MVRRARIRGAGLREIEAVYRSRLADFRRVAAAITRDREAACDVVQDAFAHAVRSRGSFRNEGPLEAWLWRTVVNAALTFRARRRAAQLADEGFATANGHRGEGAHADVQLAVSLLPERQRLVLFLRYYADLDYRTIADVLAISPGTVGATLHAAHAAVRRSCKEVLR
jgi:RNA polymerase sigma-70 factor, ECF subfamily